MEKSLNKMSGNELRRLHHIIYGCLDYIDTLYCYDEDAKTYTFMSQIVITDRLDAKIRDLYFQLNDVSLDIQNFIEKRGKEK